MSSAADDAEFQRSLLSSIHDYLQRKGFKQTAKSLLKEVKTAGLSVETCKCNLEDLWTSSQVAKKSGKVPETSKGRKI